VTKSPQPLQRHRRHDPRSGSSLRRRTLTSEVEPGCALSGTTWRRRSGTLAEAPQEEVAHKDLGPVLPKRCSTACRVRLRPTGTCDHVVPCARASSTAALNVLQDLLHLRGRVEESPAARCSTGHGTSPGGSGSAFPQRHARPTTDDRSRSRRRVHGPMLSEHIGLTRFHIPPIALRLQGAFDMKWQVI